jgi:hypothetical protein
LYNLSPRNSLASGLDHDCIGVRGVRAITVWLSSSIVVISILVEFLGLPVFNNFSYRILSDYVGINVRYFFRPVSVVCLWLVLLGVGR